MEEKTVIQKIVVAAAVVNNEGRILILQRSAQEKVFPNLWELPSGKREPLEKSTDALLREVREEAGIRIDVVSVLSVFDYQIEKPDQIRDTTQINFIARAGEGEVVMSSEHQAYAWVGASELENFQMSDETRQVILLAMQ